MSEQTFTLVGSIGIMIIILLLIGALITIGIKGSKKNREKNK
ncbi:MAG TPA: hypothetical protein VLA13_08135 [Massilibacterium sp.]|nr:hypothetical protein [Massilibacterium sp.]